MRTRILLFCGVVLAACLWLLLRRSTEEHRVTDSHEIAPATTNHLNQPVQVQATEKHQTSAGDAASVTASPIRFNTASNREVLMKQIENEWRTPINFYGEVIDESNNPVAGASISFGWTDLSKEGYSRASTTSDANGLFALEGKTGEHLSVWVGKDGYYSSKSNLDSFFYSGKNENFVPNPGTPIVFYLRKKEQAEPLIHIGGIGLHTMRDYLLAADGTPTDVSLFTGNLTPAGQGDLQVEFQAGPPLDNFPSRITWQCQVTVPGGALVQTSEEFPFLAPEDGYQVSDAWSVTVTNWTETVNQQYYVKLRNGNFGRVKLRVIGAPGRAYFRMESFLNPSGSRDLEWQDSSTQ